MSAKDVAQQVARQAFDTGLRAAAQPAAERERQRTYVIGFAGDLLTAHVEAAIDAGGTKPVPAGDVSIAEQIAAVQDAEDYRVTSLAWRRGRAGFNQVREAANERGAAAALATLRALQGGAA